ncbi:MAG: hypothetical protein D6785_02210 [Planctomycetota bacterium]|nr:MAG: hypothetical protein D6785_02210 [Planctomycetota bacterium]
MKGNGTPMISNYYSFLFSFFVLCLAGCGHISPVRYAERLHYNYYGKTPIHKSLAFGTFFDRRYGIHGKWVDPKHIKMSMEEIRRIMGRYFELSRRYDNIVYLMPDFVGKNFQSLIEGARNADCDYLLVAEISKFDIKFYTMNWRVIPSIILDASLLPLSLLVFIITAGEAMVFTGGLIAVANVEVEISAIFNLVDVRTGKVVKSFPRNERVRNPATSFQMVGYFYDSTDDWVDLGRKLGSYVVSNLSIKMVDEVADFIHPPAKKKTKN